MHNRIVMRKLNFYHHIVSLEEDAVASRVARVADRAGYPGLVKEYNTLCQELQLPHPSTMSAFSWKKKVKNEILKTNRSFLLQQIETKYEKLDYETLKEEKFELKGYVKTLMLHEGRMKFRIRSKMVKHVKFILSFDHKTHKTHLGFTPPPRYTERQQRWPHASCLFLVVWT